MSSKTMSDTATAFTSPSLTTSTCGADTKDIFSSTNLERISCTMPTMMLQVTMMMNNMFLSSP